MTETSANDSGAAQALKAPPLSERLGRRDIKPLRRLVPFLMRYPLRLALTLVFLLAAAIAQLAIPAMLGSIIDEGFLSQNLDKVQQFGWIILMLAAVMAVASGARFYFVSVLGELLVVDLRQAVFDHMMKLDMAFFDTNRIGDLTSRLNTDTGTIRGAISSNLTTLLRSLVTVIGALAMMFMTNVVPGAGGGCAGAGDHRSGFLVRRTAAGHVAQDPGRARRHFGACNRIPWGDAYRQGLHPRGEPKGPFCALFRAELSRRGGAASGPCRAGGNDHFLSRRWPCSP